MGICPLETELSLGDTVVFDQLLSLPPVLLLARRFVGSQPLRQVLPVRLPEPRVRGEEEEPVNHR